MAGRMEGKAVVVVGAGQTPGETIGNGRAMAVLFAREGGKVLCVDRVVERAEETAEQILGEEGEALAMAADVTKAADCQRVIDQAKERFGRVDVLINNV